MAAIYEYSPPIKLSPQPGFVVKTKILEGLGDHTFGKKVFINICHDDQVPKPEGEFDVEAIFAKIVKNDWEIPIVVSLEKILSDKKGVPSFVYDCCINSESFTWIQLNTDLRLILIEWAIESVETMHDLVLERDYTLPKMVSKGGLSHTEITQNDLRNEMHDKLAELKQNETAGLVQLLMPDIEDDEELPDIMNIEGRKKPLIQEIEDLSIQETQSRQQIEQTSAHEQQEGTQEGQQTGNRAGPVEPVQILTSINGIPSDELLTAGKTTMLKPDRIIASNNGTSRTLISEYVPEHILQNSQNGSTPTVNYSFTLSLQKDAENFYLIFESSQITDSIEVSYSVDANEVRVRNLDPSRQLGTENVLDIPIPSDVSPYKAFVVLSEQRLYIFGKVQKH